MRRGSPKFQAEMGCPTLHVLIRVTPFGGDLRRPHIRVVIQERREKNRHKSKLGSRALPNLTELMRRQPGIRADEIEIKVHTLHRQLPPNWRTSAWRTALQMPFLIMDFIALTNESFKPKMSAFAP